MSHWIDANKVTPRTRIVAKGENGYSMSRRLLIMYLGYTERPTIGWAMYRKDHATGRGIWIMDDGEIVNTVTHWQKAPRPDLEIGN